jgi:hypothetical protein
MSDPQREAELAVDEFLKMRAQILGELSPEVLRCVAAIFERSMKKEKTQ